MHLQIPHWDDSKMYQKRSKDTISNQSVRRPDLHERLGPRAGMAGAPGNKLVGGLVHGGVEVDAGPGPQRRQGTGGRMETSQGREGKCRQGEI